MASAIPQNALRKVTAALLGKVMICGEISAMQNAQVIEALDLLQAASAKTVFSEIYLQKLIEQLELYPERQISLNDMAQAAFVSKFCFIRKFKEETGLTPHQFLIQNKVR